MCKLKCQQSCIFLIGIDRGDSVYCMFYMYLFTPCRKRQRPGRGRKNRGPVSQLVSHVHDKDPLLIQVCKPKMCVCNVSETLSYMT